MITNLFLDFGNPTMKSIDISIYTVSEIGIDCSTPIFFTIYPFLR
jgi:hypothetical protein